MCVLLKGKMIYALYTDDSILAGPNQRETQQVIADLKTTKLTLMVKGDLEDFLGVQIKRKKDGSFHLMQPHLIDQISRKCHNQKCSSIIIKDIDEAFGF
jgi:hypothetical protein